MRRFGYYSFFENCTFLFLGLQVALHLNYIYKKTGIGQLHVADDFESIQKNSFFHPVFAQEESQAFHIG